MKALAAALLAACMLLAAAPAAAQRVLAPYELDQLIEPIAHHPDAAIQDAIATHPDLAFTYSQYPSEVWRAVLEARRRITPPASQVVIVQSLPRFVTATPRHHHHHNHPHPDARHPRHPNGPPSPAVQMQQGHRPSPAVRMQQQRIPESQRQPIVQQRHWRSAP